MGNVSTVWNCKYCDFPNYGSHETCLKCFKNKNTGVLLKSLSSLKDYSYKSLHVDKSSMVKLRLNEKASQTASTLKRSVVARDSASLDHFVDDEFPPMKQSLFMNGSRVKRSNLLHSNGFRQIKKWLRPHHISISNEESSLPVSLFADPSPKDVIQGELGTCWFLSALALLAEKPFLLLNCMVSQVYNAQGMHQVRLCKRGEWVIVNIDDYLPCDRQNQLVFSYGRKKQFWVPFMEKALAKLYGSYEAVARGACAEGLQTLTGEPCEVLYLQLSQHVKSDARLTTNPTLDSTINNNSNANLAQHSSGNGSGGGGGGGGSTTTSVGPMAPPPQPPPPSVATPSTSLGDAASESAPHFIWQKILFSRKMGYLMTTLCFNESLRFDAFDKVGLLSRHIYSILDAREFDNKGSPVRLLRLRNPWGHKEWRGDWSNGWSKWPSHIRSQVSVYLNNDGCFWISFQDVLKYFYDITICKVRADWTESRQSSYFYDYSYGTEVYMVSIKQPGVHQFEIELFSSGRRNQPFDRNADPEIDLCLVICRLNDPHSSTGLTCVAFEHSVEYYITLSASLSAGHYMVFATSIKAISAEYGERSTSGRHEPNHYSYNIIFHGQSSFTLNRTLLSPEFIADIFYAVAVKLNKVKYELNGMIRSFVIAGSCTHGIVVENMSSNVCIKTQLDISSSKNLESTRMTTITQDYLYPGSRQMLAFLTPSNYRNGYVIGYKIDNHIYQYYTTGSYPPPPNIYKGIHTCRHKSPSTTVMQPPPPPPLISN